MWPWPVSGECADVHFQIEPSHPHNTTAPPAPIIHNYFYPPILVSGTPRDNCANDIIGECSGPGAGEGINKATRHQASLGNVTTARSSLLYLLLVSHCLSA